MPIRLKDIPVLDYTRLNQAQMDLNIAAAPGKALEGLAGDIAKVSDSFAKIAPLIQEADDTKNQINALSNAQSLPQRTAEYVKNLPREQRVSEARKYAEKESKSVANDPNLSTQVRSNIKPEYDKAVSYSEVNVTADSSKEITAETRLTATREIDRSIKLGDMEYYNKLSDFLQSKQMMTDEQREQGRIKLEQQQKHISANNRALSDPDNYLKENTTPPDRAAGASEEEITQWHERDQNARRKLQQFAIESNAAYQDGMARGDFKSWEDVERRIPHASPGLKQAIKENWDQHLREITDKTEKEKAQSPETQNQISARVQHEIGNFDFQADGATEKYMEIQALVRSLNEDHPDKIRYQGILNAIDQKGSFSPKTITERGYKSINDGISQEMDRANEGIVTYMPTQDLLNHHFFSDARNLRDLGFSEEKIREIHFEGQKLYSGRNPYSPESYRKLVNEGVLNPSPTADSFVTAAGDAIAKGKTTIEYRDPEREDEKVERKMHLRNVQGVMQNQFTQWLATENNLTEAKVNQKVQELMTNALVAENAAAQNRNVQTGGIYTNKDQSQSSNDGGMVPPKANEALKAQVYQQPKAKSIQEAVGRFDHSLDKHSLEKARKEVEALAKELKIALSRNQLDALASFQQDTGQISRLLVKKPGYHSANRSDLARSKSEIAQAMLFYRNVNGERNELRERRRLAEQRVFLEGYSE